MYAIRSYYDEDRVTIRTTLERVQGKVLEFSYVALRSDGIVITSYSIHYTKLYDVR